MIESAGSDIHTSGSARSGSAFRSFRVFMKDFASEKAGYFGILRARAQGCIC